MEQSPLSQTPRQAIGLRVPIMIGASGAFSIATTIIILWLSWVVSKGAPGIGYLLLFIFTPVMVFLGNVAASLLIVAILRHKGTMRLALLILALLNIAYILITVIPSQQYFHQKSISSQKFDQQIALEKELADTPQDIVKCDQITASYVYWQSCVNLSRTVLPQEHTPSESLALCLAQANSKTFASGTEEPANICQQVFGGNQ